jgi:hypothetical protein
MEHLFEPRLPNGERPDIQICIFPHLREFLVIDLRQKFPQVQLLSTREVFREDFFANAEAEFSHALRCESDFSFAHLMNLPLRVEETVKDVAMTAILQRLGINPDGDTLPSVVVFVLSGGALTMHSEQVIQGLKRLLGEYPSGPTSQEWEGWLSRLAAEENAALEQLNQQELAEAVRGDSPDFFSLWENRN